MKTRRILTAFCIGLLTIALSAPAFAGSQGRNRGLNQKSKSSSGIQQQDRLRDGSCLTDDCTPQKSRARDRDLQKDRINKKDQDRLRDRSGRK